MSDDLIQSVILSQLKTKYRNSSHSILSPHNLALRTITHSNITHPHILQHHAPSHILTSHTLTST